MTVPLCAFFCQPAKEPRQVGEFGGLVVLAGRELAQQPCDLVEPRVVRAHRVTDFALPIVMRGRLALLQVEVDADGISPPFAGWG